jgi:hypothetical protein
MRSSMDDSNPDRRAHPRDGRRLGLCSAVREGSWSASDHQLGYPFTPPDACVSLLHQIEATPLLNQDLRTRIFRDNALNLFPQLE